ncbi:MAG: pyridoxamine 5'-phosphate oxidase family protein [Vulcanimicrobiaceae bacterium]|jgi:nitroimidazol reductase NimA-like FMN-containing flavoprotein (pyridoxamine 5'-phosphate oxidase superfamily)
MQTRLRVRRHPERGVYDPEPIYAILDEGMIAHVGFQAAESPIVIPTAYGRDGDCMYLHGSAVAFWCKTMAEGVPVCVTVTLTDGLVLARSTFKHSMNYRSVMIYGNAQLVSKIEEKLHGLERIVEHLVPGRSREARSPNEKELTATSVLKLSLDEASAKVRTGGPLDDRDDFERLVWAGVLPLRTTYGPPISDPAVPPIVGIPDYVLSYKR